MDMPVANQPEDTALPDVSEHNMMDLLSSRDPVLLASLARLTELLRFPSDVRSGWSSAIDVQ